MSKQLRIQMVLHNLGCCGYNRGMLKSNLRYFMLCIVIAAILAIVQPAMAQDSGPSIQTATPLPDGSIVHIISAGDSLAVISQAYGISLADIRAMNGMDPTSNLIFPGQHLILRTALPATETPTITLTLPRPTRTPTPVTPTRTPRPTFTPSPTLTPSSTPNPILVAADHFIQVSREPLLYAMVAICVIGLLWVILKGFFGK